MIYLLDKTEFDAYSQEITKYIEDAYNNTDNKEIIIKWLSSSLFGEKTKNAYEMLKMPENLYYIIKFWKENNPIFFKKLRQRIYNEIKK